jgi:hypothetical protein
MAENSIKAQLPRLPHPAFFSTADYTIRTSDGSALVSYDPETRAGFVYTVSAGVWSISAPIAFLEFAALVAAAGYVVSDSPDARRWFAACSVLPAPGGRARN